MIKPVTFFALILLSLAGYSQYYSGYYVSQPQVHSFDHFKIKQDKNEVKTDGDLVIHAFYGKKLEIWEMRGELVDAQQEAYLISEYGQGKDIISVHSLKFMWDGNEWEYFLLGYLGEDKHRHFVVIEEIFNDETETELLEFNTFDWVKAHHITAPMVASTKHAN